MEEKNIINAQYTDTDSVQADILAENGSGAWVPFAPDSVAEKAVLYNAQHTDTNSVHALTIQDPADILAENGSGVWVPFAPESVAEKAVLYNALNSAGEKLSDYVGNTITVSNIILQGSTFTDEETGEIQKFTRLIMVGDEGQIYKTTSRGLVRAAVQLMQVFGTPNEWGQPLNIQIERVQLRKGFTYNFKVVA